MPARGPEAARAVLACGLEVSWRAPTETLVGVVDHVLDRPSVDGVRIALQCDGGRPDRGIDELRGSGADVVDGVTLEMRGAHITASDRADQRSVADR